MNPNLLSAIYIIYSEIYTLT